MVETVGSGEFKYEVDVDWAHLPDGWEMSAAAVSGDSQDRVYVYDRGDHPVMVFDREGNFLKSWGEGQMKFPHAVYIDSGDNVWLVDNHAGVVTKHTTDGQLLLTLGQRGFRSNTGVPDDYFKSDAFEQVTHGGPPFNLPAGIAVAPSGNIFVADGYGNSRVHKFTGDGTLLKSWGEPGTKPGQFNLPHGIWVDSRERLLVADRENDRVQAFSQDGDFLDQWNLDLIGPAVVHVDDNDIAYVPEHNGGLFSIITLDGERIARWGSDINITCHGAWVDSLGDVYVVQPGNFGKKRRGVKFHRK